MSRIRMKSTLVAASLAVFVVTTAAQTPVTAPKNKYSPADDVKLGQEAAVRLPVGSPVVIPAHIHERHVKSVPDHREIGRVEVSAANDQVDSAEGIAVHRVLERTIWFVRHGQDANRLIRRGRGSSCRPVDAQTAGHPLGTPSSPGSSRPSTSWGSWGSSGA